MVWDGWFRQKILGQEMMKEKYAEKTTKYKFTMNRSC